ncbi:MAG: hypothetical protein RR250_01970 [Akkermansia sp.]
MCKPLKEYLSVLRDYKDIIVMFGGAIACIFIYSDFKAVVKQQAETSARTAETLHTIDTRLSNLEHK